MERLPVFKALGDNTRYAIYLELARSRVPLSTADIAETLDLHPNTVRPHLERMRDAGLLEVEVDNRGTVGRPQHRYFVAPEAPSLGLEPPAFPVLAVMLARVASALAPSPEDVAEAGRVQGRVAAQRRARAADTTGGSGGRGPAPRGPGSGDGVDGAAGSACIRALTSELADLGFDPASVQDGEAIRVAFTRCPFQNLAEAHPDLVCHLHRGIVEGMVEELGGAVVERFGTLVDRDPCQVDLVVQ